MLHQRDDPRRHEPPRPHRRPAAGPLGHLDDAARRRHLEPPSVARRDHVETLRAVASVDDDRHPIALHAVHDTARPLRRTRGWTHPRHGARAPGTIATMRRWNGWGETHEHDELSEEALRLLEKTIG